MAVKMGNYPPVNQHIWTLNSSSVFEWKLSFQPPTHGRVDVSWRDGDLDVCLTQKSHVCGQVHRWEFMETIVMKTTNCNENLTSNGEMGMLFWVEICWNFHRMIWQTKDNDKKSSTIWLFNCSPWKITIFKNGKPSISMGHGFHGYVSHNQMVNTSDWEHFTNRTTQPS